MKKLIIVAIAMVLLASNTGVVLAAPDDNPNGFWGYVTCGDESYWAWKPDEHALPAFSIPEKDGKPGQVGIMVSAYIIPDVGDPKLVWKLSPNHVFKDTIWCTWEEDNWKLGGDVRILGR